MRTLLQPLALGLALAACSDASGPSARGPTFFVAAVNGTPLAAPDRIIAVLVGATPDSARLDIVADKLGPNGLFNRLDLYLRRVPQPGTAALADTTAPGSGVYLVQYQDVSVPSVGLGAYYTHSAEPGFLRITAVNSQDSIVAGTFSFRASPTLDPNLHVSVTGQFRVRYTFVQISYPSQP